MGVSDECKGPMLQSLCTWRWLGAPSSSTAIAARPLSIRRLAETRVLELSFTYPNQKIQEKPGLVLVRRCGILGPRDILVAIGVHAEKEVIQ